MTQNPLHQEAKVYTCLHTKQCQMQETVWFQLLPISSNVRTTPDQLFVMHSPAGDFPISFGG